MSEANETIPGARKRDPGSCANFTIAVETPLSDDVRALVAALNEWALTETPREFCHHMTVEQMAEPNTTVFIARGENGAAVGMGALKRHGEGLGEVKRMFTRPEARERNIAGRIVQHIEALARQEGLARLALETGATPGFHPAWRVYEREGFQRCGAFLDYPADSPHNIYYEKLL
ncbi:MAG TPA: GNAT family N-acetyltransferase [Caulobacterales bacterium]|nr:GNAT family N-acetyltransferase [Caulobacterales bacterium]